MTSDGISQEDWDRVGDLAAEIVNASSAGDQVLDESLTEALLDHLNDLEGKKSRCLSAPMKLRRRKRITKTKLSFHPHFLSFILQS